MERNAIFGKLLQIKILEGNTEKIKEMNSDLLRLKTKI